VRKIRNHQCGFSLIELLIVIAILLILAAIAIPQLLRARISANEAAAVAEVRSVHTSELEYQQYYPQIGFADDISKLGPPATNAPATAQHAGLLDFVLGCNQQPCFKGGYWFAIDQTSGTPTVDTFRVTSVPQVPGQTGTRGFCAASTGVITYDPAGGTVCKDQI
jgi:prepilin-type N-terminal cleavage/methylation domain-containing protein